MDEELAALHWAMHHRPPPEHVMKAHQAQADLWTRIKSEPYRPLTRDEKRLDRRYQSIHDTYVADVLDAYRDR